MKNLNRLAVFFLLALGATTAFAAETQRYLVSTRTAPRRDRLSVMSTSADMAKRRVRTFKNINAFAADLTAAEVAELKASSDVVLVEPVIERHAFGIEDGPATQAEIIRYNEKQYTPWGIPQIGAPEVWSASKGSTQVHVAVIDTGIDYEHPDLKHAYMGGYNTFDPAKTPLDDHRHGTHVAGTIAAADNGFGVIGVAPNVKLWAVKVLDDDGKGTSETLTAGIDWVVAKAKETGGRWVINMSLGSRFGSDIEREAITRALADGIVVVAACGNSSLPFMNYPAGYQGVIAVGAANDDNTLAAFSTYGVGMSLIAPGVNVTSTFRGGTNSSADVIQGNALVDAVGITGSPFGNIIGRLVDCGLGRPEDFPSSVRNRIALVRRGEFPFREKARNAKDAGALAVVIVNDPALPNDVDNWTMTYRNCTINGCIVDPEWENYVFPLTVGVEGAQANAITALINKTVTVGFRPEDYGALSGTSMASPHVAGSAALLLSLAPDLNVAQLTLALEKTAKDLGEPGWDLRHGWGVIDLNAAARYVAPGLFGLPDNGPTPTPRRRGTRH
ncbi:MAG TPA: S8 family serine peptidase [Thermoanaerobaculia bacterium]|nr:S8 family serine peptidase [Thermoanaerobaculia bacterium]